jgi:hypothetical protein
MAGRDERRGGDLDDWFDEPQPPRVGQPQSSERLTDAAAGPAPASEDDWLGAPTTRRPVRGPRLGRLAELSERERGIVYLVVALVVLLFVGLALGGVFSGSSTPQTAATTTAGTTHAATTTAATTPTKPVVVAVPSGPLKPGDSGAAVKVLQQALASLGFSPGKIDGVYGSKTTDAVTRFQTSAKITADGIVGSETLAALQTAVNSGG